MDFYSHIVNCKVDLNDFFVIKTIGDEIWIVYDLTKSNTKFKILEFNEIVTSIIEAIENINYKDYHIVIPERKLTPEEEENFDLQENISFKHIQIIPRVFIDLIENFEEANHIRYDMFEKRFSSLFPYKLPIEIKLEERELKFPEYLNNLNFGTHLSTSNDKKIRISFRFDPIGFEIDKFFRCTKYGKTGIISIGQKLFDNLYITQEINQLENNCFIERLVIPHGNQFSTFYNYYSCIYKVINKEHLKGVGEDYRIYYLYKKELLPPYIKDERYRENYNDTIELLNQYDNI